jgi:antitoxin MazE
MSTATIGRWGKSLAVRLPSEIASRLSLTEGATVDVEQRDDEIVIRKLARPLTLEILFAGKSPEEWRAIYREHGVDWGPDVGREIVDE